MNKKIVPYDQRRESIVNKKGGKKECFGQYWFINLSFKVCHILEQVLKDHKINKGLEEKELLDIMQ